MAVRERADMKQEIIIFGAGKNAANTYEWAVFAGYRVLLFVDNDPLKWGKRIHSVLVESPEILKRYHCAVLIPDAYQSEIEKQLAVLSYQGHGISLKQLKKEAVCKKENAIHLVNGLIGNHTTFIFDAYFSGMNWGGVESWSCMVANQLSTFGVPTRVFCGLNKKFDEFTENSIHFWGKNEWELVKKMAKKIAGYLPCVFLSHASIALYAAQIVKSIFPDKIKLVVVAHGDERNTYENLEYWSDRIDKIICISRKIQDELESNGIKKNLLLYRPNPIQLPKIDEQKILQKKAVKVGFAARLRREQKRTHLLPEIIDLCMRKNLNVEFHIAGEGDCLEMLLAYAARNHLEDKVHIWGWIPPTKMADFWREQDIYLNISDFEGMSLTMLEAMSCGATPVVTDVSGVCDVIENGKNGFIVPVDEWLKSVEKIELLSKDRQLLEKAKTCNMGVIRGKCNLEDYAGWLLDTFRFAQEGK